MVFSPIEAGAQSSTVRMLQINKVNKSANKSRKDCCWFTSQHFMVRGIFLVLALI